MTQAPKQPSAKPRQLLASLIANAVDFLEQSLADFEQKPKYSVIHFYAALELFLKARLVAEHWSLCVAKRQEPDWDKFVRGDFQSVTLEESADRLEKAVRSGLTVAEKKCFDEVRKHRNRMVHFFHEVANSADGSELRRQIAKEQLNAWYFLHRLLMNTWKKVFIPYMEKLSELDDRMRHHQVYLQVVFDNVKPEIEENRAAGLSIGTCSACGYEAQISDSSPKIGELCDGVCLVCSHAERFLLIECQECGARVATSDYTHGACASCGRVVDPEGIADFLTKDLFEDKDDSFSVGVRAHCHFCDGYETVVPYQDNYFCTECFMLFDESDIWWCGWCSAPNAGGSSESSTWSGCAACGGWASWEDTD